MLAHTSNPSTKEAEVRQPSWVQSQSGLQSEFSTSAWAIVTQNKQKTMTKCLNFGILTTSSVVLGPAPLGDG